MRRRELKTRWMNACANRTFIGIKQKFNASIIAQENSSEITIPNFAHMNALMDFSLIIQPICVCKIAQLIHLQKPSIKHVFCIVQQITLVMSMRGNV